MTRKQVLPRRRQHPFVLDPSMPFDWEGRGTCRDCNKLGRAGDAQHPEPDPNALDDAREVDARRLGEAGHNVTDDLHGTDTDK